MTHPAAKCYINCARDGVSSALHHRDLYGADAPLPPSLWAQLEESLLLLTHLSQSPKIAPPSPLSSPADDSIAHLAKIGEEFVQSERAYIHFLEVTEQYYYRVESTSAQVFQALSSSLSGIIEVHKMILYEIEENMAARSGAQLINPRHSEIGELGNFQFSPPPRVSALQAYPRDLSSLCHELNKRSTHGLIGDICHQLMDHVVSFEMYAGYIEEFTRTMRIFHDQKKSSTSFQEYLESSNTNARAALSGQVDSRVRLEDLMIMPVQRIPRYILFLREMLKCTEGSYLHRNLQECMEELENLVLDIDRLREEQETVSRLSEMKRLIKMPYRNIFEFSEERDRRAVNDGRLTRLTHTGGTVSATKVHLFLLNDLLLLASYPVGYNTLLLNKSLPFKAIIPFRSSTTRAIVTVTDISTEEYPFGFMVEAEYATVVYQETFAVASRKLNHVWIQEMRKLIEQLPLLPLLESSAENDLLEPPAMSGWLLQKRSKVNLWQIKFFQCRGKSLFAFSHAEDASDGDFISRYDLRDTCIRLIPKFGFLVEFPNSRSHIHLRVCEQGDIVIRQWLHCFTERALQVDKTQCGSTPISQEDAEEILKERGVLNVKEWTKLRPRSAGPLSSVRVNLSVIEKYNPINYSLLDILDQ